MHRTRWGPRGSAWAVLSIVAGCLLFRIPALLNPAALDSDSAIVGLQAWHLARGEVTLHLWGTSYQGIVEPLLAMLPLAAFAHNPALGLLLSGLTAHLVLLISLFSVLRRGLGAALAGLATATLVVCPEPLNFQSFSPQRNWSFALMFVALWLLERNWEASSARRQWGWAFGAGVAVGFAYYSHLFTVQLLPGLAAYLAAGVISRKVHRWLPSIAVLIGVLVGSIPRFAGHLRGTGGSMLSLSHLPRTWPLLWDRCLPYALGTKIFASPDGFARPLLDTGPLGYGLGIAGMGAFAALAIGGGILSLTRQCPPWARRVAWCGSAWVLVSLLGFLLSPRAFDLMHARYLVPVLLGFPLASAPALVWLEKVNKRGLASLLLGAVIVHFAFAGWYGYGSWIDPSSLLPRSTDYGNAREERLLLASLRQRKVRGAWANYWVAYRLSFLWREDLLVAPVTDDRYRPYVQEVSGVQPVARIFFQPADGVDAPMEWEAALKREDKEYQRIEVGPYIAFVSSASEGGAGSLHHRK